MAVRYFEKKCSFGLYSNTTIGYLLKNCQTGLDLYLIENYE